MAEAAKRQLIEAMEAATSSGNFAVMEHIRAALRALEGPAPTHGAREEQLRGSGPAARREKGTKSGTPVQPCPTEEDEEVDGVGRGGERSAGRGGRSPSQPNTTEKPFKSVKDPTGSPMRPPKKIRKYGQGFAEYSPEERSPRKPIDARDLDLNSNPKDQPPLEKFSKGLPRNDEAKDGTCSFRQTCDWPSTMLPLRPTPGDHKGAGGIYPALLHSMGYDRQMIRDSSAQLPIEHQPPRRLSSFVAHAMKQGEFPQGFKMEPTPNTPTSPESKASTTPGSVPIAQPRARKAIVRQNSNLSDSILTQRSLLGTGRAPAALYHPPLHVPGMAGMPALHRHPQRTATSLQGFQRLAYMSNQAPSGAAERQHPMRAAGQAGPPVLPQKVLWNGNIKHSSAGNMVNLCSLVCMLPAEASDMFPATLFINELVLRDNVQLGRHILISCSLNEPSTEQKQNLGMMSHMKLTGVVKLQHCEFIVCPLVDEKGDIKVIGFLLAT